MAAALEAGLVAADRVVADLAAVAPEADLVAAPNLLPQHHPHLHLLLHLHQHPPTTAGHHISMAFSKVHSGIDSPMMSMRRCNSQEGMLGTQVVISLWRSTLTTAKISDSMQKLRGLPRSHRTLVCTWALLLPWESSLSAPMPTTRRDKRLFRMTST